MYVCNCNGISERMVATALNAGARTWDEVHEYFECKPCCGKCNTEITATIRQYGSLQKHSAKRLPSFGNPILAGNV